MEEYVDEKGLYSTGDYLIASCLCYFDHILETLDKGNPSRCIFSFRRNSFTDEIIERFYRGELLVEPKRFQAIQKELKGRIYN